ncbi:hypothetical protein BS47DRAFT_1303063 [Hydnum rufescens UP504]|uniref:HMG box domain-containing protein n=1 Tax=Hydnum rufescens UP504 TaxID=1448309 RepID=A0A9P6AMD4_9AGAM|nr:hypothetical protein BS47DRAFT_1303063 [Hydnum rufescens UP504]
MLDNDGQLSQQQSQESQQHPHPRRTSSFTFLEPLTSTTPIFPLRRQSHITLNGRRSSRSQAARRVVSHAAKKPDGHIPRPPNCFLLYRSWVRQQNKLHGKSSDGTHKKNEQNVSVIVGTLWEDLPEEKKEIFRAEARRLKEEHMKRYPGYKYSPRTKKGNNGHNAPQPRNECPSRRQSRRSSFPCRRMRPRVTLTLQKTTLVPWRWSFNWDRHSVSS